MEGYNIKIDVIAIAEGTAEAVVSFMLGDVEVKCNWGHWIGWNGGGSVRLGLVSLLTEIGLFMLMTVPGVLNVIFIPSMLDDLL